MTRLVGDPLPRFGEGQRTFRVRVMTQRAGDGHQPVAEPTILQIATPLAGSRGDGVAAHALRQLRDRAAAAMGAVVRMRVERMAVTQVGDAGAADLADARQRGRERRRAQDHVDPVAAALQRCAVVRRAHADQMAQELQPDVIQPCGLTAGAARDQSAHAVADDRDLVDRHRPLLLQGVELFGELSAVVGDRQPGVVVQIQRRVAQRIGEHRAVIVAVARPLQIVHAQAVDQDQQLRAVVRNRFDQCLRSQRQGFACMVQAHRQGQGIAGRGEVIAEHTVEHRDHRFALRRSARVRACVRALREQGIERAAGEAGHAADAAVHQPGDAGRALRRRTADAQMRARDRGMHGFDEIGDAGGRAYAQAREAVEVGQAQEIPVDHGEGVSWPCCVAVCMKGPCRNAVGVRRFLLPPRAGEGRDGGAVRCHVARPHLNPPPHAGEEATSTVPPDIFSSVSRLASAWRRIAFRDHQMQVIAAIRT